MQACPGPRTRSLPDGRLEDWLSTRRVIHVLSPHVDDAIYSLGGWIARSPRPIVIHNVFTETRFTSVGPRSDAGALRRREEDAAIAVLAPRADVERRYHGFPDLSARPPDLCLAQLDQELLDLINAITSPSVDAWFVPAGVGGHPDHLRVAAAASKLAGIRYCEIPYLMWDRSAAASATDVLQVDIELHLAAMSCFGSQVAPEVEWRQPLEQTLRGLKGLPVMVQCCS
jgi:LmbE family N-acetylglucosaminyl deacetylase